MSSKLLGLGLLGPILAATAVMANTKLAPLPTYRFDPDEVAWALVPGRNDVSVDANLSFEGIEIKCVYVHLTPVSTYQTTLMSYYYGSEFQDFLTMGPIFHGSKNKKSRNEFKIIDKNNRKEWLNQKKFFVQCTPDGIAKFTGIPNGKFFVEVSYFIGKTHTTTIVGSLYQSYSEPNFITSVREVEFSNDGENKLLVDDRNYHENSPFLKSPF